MRASGGAERVFPRARLLPVLCLALVTSLTACGGGGGGGATPAATLDPEPPEIEEPEPAAPEPPAVEEPAPEPPAPAAPFPETPFRVPAPLDPPPEDVVFAADPEPAPEPTPSTPTPTPSPMSASSPTAADFSGDAEYCGGRASLTEDGATFVFCRNWGLGAVGAAAAYARLAARDAARNAEREDAEGEDAVAAPGTGVTVGFIDTGIDIDRNVETEDGETVLFPGHWEFDDSRASMTVIQGSGDSSGTAPSHGTQVASVVGARRDGAVPRSLASFDFHGVAWGADLKMFAVTLGSGGGSGYDPLTVSELRDDIDPWLTALLEEALKDEHGVDILNMSFSVYGLAENYGADDIAAAMDDAIAAATQSGRDDADKTLLVWSAGNANETTCYTTDGHSECVSDKVVASSPSITSALPLFAEALRGHAVSVAATRPDGVLAWFSNRCGVAAKYCIAAPGQWITTAVWGRYEGADGVERNQQRGYGLSNGTSFAAPLVAGGLAVLKHYFRDQMGNTELLARLFATADVTPDTVADGGSCPAHLDLDGDLSDCELSSTHGRGLMDLDAATQPVGMTSIALGSALGGERAPAMASLLRGGSAAGDALSAAFRGREIAVFDDLGAPFWMSLNGFARAAARPAIDERLARFTDRGDGAGAPGGAVNLNLASTPLWVGVNRMSDGAGRWGGHASLVPVREGGMSLTWGGGALRASAFAAAPPPSRRGWWASDSAPRLAAAGAELAWRPSDSPFALRLGSVREFESALGATASGAFGSLSSGLVFAGAGARGAAGGWTLAAGAELGVAAPQASRGLVSGVSSVATSAFSVSAERPAGAGGRLRLSLSQPLRVESGRLRLSVPAGRTKRGEVVRRTVDAPLSPGGRQLDLAADWRAPVDAAGGEARLGATLSLHPGHAAASAPELVLLAAWRLPF